MYMGLTTVYLDFTSDLFPAESENYLPAVARANFSKFQNLILSDAEHPPYWAFTGMAKAVTTDFPSLVRPRRNPALTYYNYVAGIYRHSGKEFVAFRTGRYDESKLGREGSKASWQVETQMGIKHRQLVSTDISLLFSGVLISGPEGVVVSPISGTWLARKAVLLGQMHQHDSSTPKNTLDAWLDLVNVMYTQNLLRKMSSEGGVNIRGLAVNDRIVPVRGAIPVTMSRECKNSYVARVTTGQAITNPNCLKNIPGLIASS